MVRRLRYQALVAVLLFVLLTMPLAAAPITTASVTTDRSDYITGMAVTATGTFAYTGSFNSVDEPALAQWYNATWALQRAEYVTKTRVQAQNNALAVATWTPPAPGVYYVNMSSNQTNGTPPRVSASRTFRVWAPTDYVIARGLGVSTDRSFYEQGQLATATANFTASPAWVIGNVSRLERVQFNWYYPSGAPARRFVNVSVVSGEARDSWTPDLIGSTYRVNVTYLGNDTVSNETRFPVFVASTPAGNVTAGQSAVWDAARSPWRVCGDLTVDTTGSLTIEANATVKFCPGSRLIVRGTLTADGSPSAPIRLTSYAWPPAPGDWRGVRFEGAADSRLVHAVVEYVRDGVLAVRSSPTLVGVVTRFGTGEAFNLTDSSAALRDANVTGFARGVRLWNATSLVNNVSTYMTSGDGVRIDLGSPEVRNSRIVRAGGSGLAVSRSSPTLENVTLVANWRHGLYVTDSSDVLGRDLRISGGNYSVRALATAGLRLERVDVSGAAFRAVDLTGTTLLVANGTISSGTGGQDFLLVASTATLLNSTFTDDVAKRTIVSPSRLVVQNFLTVRVATAAGDALPGVRVVVSVNGSPLPSRTTDALGLAAWFVIEDRVYTAANVTKNEVAVSVSATGYTVAGSPRAVDMATSRLETFVATPIGPGNDGPSVLGMDVRVLVGVLAAALLLGLGVVVWRRRRADDAEGEEPPPEPDPGTSYAVLEEKPDRAFEALARAVSSGAPGLAVTRIRPEDARARFGLDGVLVHWLSRSFGKETLNPTNLGAIVALVRKEAADRPGLHVLLDGLEYLFTQNEFGKVVKFVQALADVVAEAKAVLYLPIDPRALDEDRLAVLTRDLRRLE